jgi:hypothetical protein
LSTIRATTIRTLDTTIEHPTDNHTIVTVDVSDKILSLVEQNINNPQLTSLYGYHLNDIQSFIIDLEDTDDSELLLAGPLPPT